MKGAHLATLPSEPPRPERRGEVGAPTARDAGGRLLTPFDLLLPAAMVLWLISVNNIRLSAIGDYGLVSALPVTYFLALAVVVLSFLVFLRSHPPPAFRLCLHIGALVIILHGTVPLLFSEPRYAWVYIHFGVVNYINAHGRVNQAVDIYQNWPGFFALTAWFTKVAGAGDPIHFAAWAQVYFNLLNALACGFALKPLTRSVRRRFLAVFVFVAANWVGQDYFAPQAFGFFLSLLILGIVLRWCLSARGSGWFWALERYGQRIVRARTIAKSGRTDNASGPSKVAVSEGAVPRRMPRYVPVTIAYGLFATAVISHQLSPYMVVLAVGLMTCAGLVKPRWLVIGFIVLAVGYLAPHFGFVDRNYGILDAVGNPFRNAHNADVAVSQGQPGRLFAANAARLLSIGLWAIAGVGALRRFRTGLPTIPILFLAGSPALIVLGQSYGGEAIYRVFLFALPWSAFLAVEAFAPSEERWSVMAGLGAGAVVVVVLGLFIPSYFGLDEVNQIRTGEVAAARYFYEHARAGNVLMLAGPNFPLRFTANYDKYAAGTTDPVLINTRSLAGRRLGPADLTLIDDVVRGSESAHATAGYLAISTTMTLYAHEFGLVPDGTFEALDQTLVHAPGWHVFYRNPDAVIFEFSSA